MSEPIRVLQVFAALDSGGVSNFVMNLYREIDTEKIQFDFAMTAGEKSLYDDEVLARGGRIFYFDTTKDVTTNLRRILREEGPFQVVHVRNRRPEAAQPRFDAFGDPYRVLGAQDDVFVIRRHGSGDVVDEPGLFPAQLVEHPVPAQAFGKEAHHHGEQHFQGARFIEQALHSRPVPDAPHSGEELAQDFGSKGNLQGLRTDGPVLGDGHHTFCHTDHVPGTDLVAAELPYRVHDIIVDGEDPGRNRNDFIFLSHCRHPLPVFSVHPQTR